MSTQDTPQTENPTENNNPNASADAAARALATARRLGNPLLLAALLVAGLATWQWYSVRQQTNGQQALAHRLDEADNSDRESRVLLKQAQEQNAALLARLNSVEEKLNAYAEQAGGLESVYRDLAINREVAILAEMEHALTLASQQLRVSADLNVAIQAVQTADARLGKLDTGRFAPVRKALAHDLDKLRSTPNTDWIGASQRLETLIASVDDLPLSMDARPSRAKAKATVTADSDWLDRLGSTFWDEFKGLIRVERLDSQSPLLLPPEQQYFVRENLKLRLLSARLALQARDGNSYRHELSEARELLERFFNARQKQVEAAQNSVKQLAVLPINAELPTLQDSLSALRQAQQVADRKAKP